MTGDFDLDDSVLDQLRGLGAPQDVIDQASSKKQKGDFEVFPENWETLTVFLRLGSQWRVVGGMGGMMYQGIDFSAIEPCLRLMRIKPKKWPRVFEAIAAMSEEAAAVINEKQKANAA